MKELFDQLRDLMPQERGSKASKWEILTKAISEYQRQNDQIRLLHQHCQQTASDIDLMRRELQQLRLENSQLRNDLASQQSNGTASHVATAPTGPPPPAVQPPPTFASDPFGSSSRPELPPLRSLSNSLPAGPDSMTGVQYEPPRANGFRTERY